MKVAVSATRGDLDSPIDPRFGRCSFFVIVDTEDMTHEAFDNESIGLGGGAGIQAAQFVASKGVKAVVTGNCGPNAVKVLVAAGIQLFTSQEGTVREAIERVTGGRIQSTQEPNVSDHHGMAAGPAEQGPGVEGTGPCGRGRGMGRGMGMGMGRRCLSGTESIDPAGSDLSAPASLSRDEEIQMLSRQAAALKQQAREMEARIQALNKG